MTLVIAQQEEPGGLADEKCQVGPFVVSRGGSILVSVEGFGRFLLKYAAERHS